MPTLQNFGQWLIANNHPGAANSYPGAIDRISEHYSQHGEAINIYDIDDSENLEPIRLLYQTIGDFGEFGSSHGGLYRAAINKYRDFLQSMDGGVPLPDGGTENERFSFERDLQKALCGQIPKSFPGYKLFKTEYPIGNRRIDVLLENPEDNSLLAIELKAGVAGAAVLAQIAEYMGLLRRQHPEKTVKGAIVAAEISEQLRLAVSGTGATNISLQTYKMSLQLNAAE